ncbi:MAG: hypothetical protein JNK68_12645 [Betaproteobacteria bacterium]|nr:hypothetical protein [Betaproteobacteria bacterium]
MKAAQPEHNSHTRRRVRGGARPRGFSCADLCAESHAHRGSGGRSEENADLGFRPAFRDDATGEIYASCFRDGRPAPIHLYDGLPDDVVLARSALGHVSAVKPTLVSGFLRCGRFYTREEAATVVRQALPAAA